MATAIHVYHPEADRVRAALHELVPERAIVACSSEEALRAALGEVEILLAGRLPPGILASAPRLRWLQQMGVGVDHLLRDSGLRGDVQLTCLRGAFAAHVAEHAVALLLALQRGLPGHLSHCEARRWQPFGSAALAGATATVVGLGSIGARIARTLHALDVHVLGVRRSAQPCSHVAELVPPAGLGTALSRSQILINAAPLTPATRDLIAGPELARLPAGALIVSVSRGGIVNEPALLAALASGAVGGAALDVFASEPLPPDSPWWRAPNTIVTCHSAGLARDHLRGVCAFFARNLARHDAGEPLLGLVDRAAGY
jgi:phosphoglycerate dehydrogenase-like enzyme